MLSKMVLAHLIGMSQMLPEQASTFAEDVDNLYLFLVGTTIFFTVLIVGAIVYFLFKYRRRSESELPQPIAGSMVLESLWTVIPFLISIGMFAWGAKIYFDQYTIPKDALDVYVVGKQWMWKFQHPEGQREINELHVPVGQKVRLIMSTEDVLHSFFVPAFRTKQDLVPGPNRYSTIWFEATQTGKFHIFCAEYCGTQHSGMIGWVNVMSKADYQAWLSGGNAGGSLAERGTTLFTELGCATCHRSDAQGQCPKLEGVFGNSVPLQGGGTVVADESYLRESILNPTAKIVAGYQPLMPSFQGQISEEQLMQLIAYIKSLNTSASATSTKTVGAGTDAPSSNAVAGSPLMSTGSSSGSALSAPNAATPAAEAPNAGGTPTGSPAPASTSGTVRQPARQAAPANAR